MEWGDIPPLQTKVIRLLEGDLCAVVVNACGLQVDDANLYCIGELRPTNMALKTMCARMDAICQFYNWSSTAGTDINERGIDVKERIESGQFFTWEEVAALRGDLRRNLRKLSTSGRRHSRSSLKTIRVRKVRKDKTVVSNAHWRNRCVAIRDYVVWMAELVIGRMSPRDERLAEFRERMAYFKENVVGEIRVRSKELREGLSEEAKRALLDAITPGHPTNPFAVRHQLRNYALWLTYYDGGIRLSEAIGLKGVDLALNGAKPMLTVHRRPDDKDDTRSAPANTKTLPHPVALTARLSDALYKFVVNARRDYKDAKRCPYVFVSQKGGRLTGQAVREMYLQLRDAVPELPEDFSTHILRYTWNDRFGAAAEELDLSETEEKAVRNSAQGWVPTSDRGQNYQNRRNREGAAEVVLRMQDEATGTGSGDAS